MTSTPAGPVLTPTEDLLFQVAVARHRLGDTPYHLEARHRRTARALAEKGLVRVEESGIVENTIRVSLTLLGELVGISDYIPPALRSGCPSFYLGPRSPLRVDCDRRRGHPGKHRASIAGVRLAWTHSEADGRGDPLYAEHIAQHEAEERHERDALRTAIAEGRIDWTTGTITGAERQDEASPETPHDAPRSDQPDQALAHAPEAPDTSGSAPPHPNGSTT